MKLIVLGSGTGTSGPEKATSGFALEMPRDTVLVDLGYSCFKNLQKTGIDYTKVNKMFFTHFEHLDHINDLGAFIFAKKGSIFSKLSKPSQVDIFGGPGFEEFTKNFLIAFPWLKDPLFKLNSLELEPFTSKKFPGFSLKTKPMEHMPSSIAFRFEAGGKSVVLAGDTAPNENLVELSKGADLLVVECNFAEKETPIHLNASQFAKVASRAGVKKAMITHIDPQDEGKDFRALVSKGFGGEVLLAKDLMEVEI